MRKAQFDIGKEWILWTFRIGIVVIALMFLFMIVYVNVSKREDAGTLDHHAIQQKLLYSEECFVFSDEKGTARPGIFDTAKLQESRLQSCIPDANYGVWINLSIIENKTTSSQILSINKDILKDRVLCPYKKAVDCTTEKHYVLVREKEIFKPAYLEVLVMGYKKR
jgi:hypothetical protein